MNVLFFVIMDLTILNSLLFYLYQFLLLKAPINEVSLTSPIGARLSISYKSPFPRTLSPATPLTEVIL